jgi:hypothetical protein
MLRLINTGSQPIVWGGVDPNAWFPDPDAIFSHSSMPKLKRGDSISCRVSSSEIVGPYRDYDEILNFVIVATDERGYYLFVPNYMFIKNTMIADKYRCKKLGIENRFLGEEIVYISENLVAAVDRKRDGIRCKVCNEFFPYAESNQGNGSFVCYSCRQNPWH